MDQLTVLVNKLDQFKAFRLDDTQIVQKPNFKPNFSNYKTFHDHHGDVM